VEPATGEKRAADGGGNNVQPATGEKCGRRQGRSARSLTGETAPGRRQRVQRVVGRGIEMVGGRGQWGPAGFFLDTGVWFYFFRGDRLLYRQSVVATTGFRIDLSII
jgi:hypothetical protein